MRVLDLFCGAGGAAMGLHRAWPDAEIGVDIRPQPRYPFRFIQADAMTFPLEGYDFIWASPSCKAFSVAGVARRRQGWKYENQIPALRQRLVQTGCHYVIENVVGAPLLAGSVRLCGTMFGLPLFRHRYFENNIGVLVPPHRTHKRGAVLRKEIVCVAGWTGHTHGTNFSVQDYKRALGIDWMERDELREAVPPAYAEFIAKQVPL